MAALAVAESDDPFLDEFAEAVRLGLAQERKEIPCRFFYDARGSKLFEEITELDEYYPTRTEIALLQRHGPEIGQLAGAGCAIVEFGSGSSRKTRILIDHMNDLAAYVPIDIADTALNEAAERLEGHYPELAILPVHADFNQEIALPETVTDVPKIGFFPGSTIGNLSRDGAQDFLANSAELLGDDGSLVIGVDLKKDEKILTAAYDDAQGVTAEFNLNLLDRINRELGGNFDLARFKHEAVYNAEAGRIEIYIVSLADQHVTVQGETYRFAKDERMHTENSHKYSVGEFHDRAGDAGWEAERVWTDADELFSVHFLRRA